MDLGIREWLLIIGALLLLVLMIDGYRRLRRDVNQQTTDTQNLNLGEDQGDNSDPLIYANDLSDFDDHKLDPQIPILMDSIDDEISHITEINHHDSAPAHEKTTTENSDSPPQILIIHLTAKSQEVFEGHELIEALQQFGLKYGNMKIFHRYGRVNGRESIRFSVVNAIEPGYFDLQSIDDLATPGISLFMKINNHPEPEQALSDMIDTAYQLAHILNADLHDEHRSVLTKQTLGHYKERIQNYRRLVLSRRAAS